MSTSVSTKVASTYPKRRWTTAEQFILSIPIINAAADATTNYFDAGSLNPGVLRGAILLPLTLLGLLGARLGLTSGATLVFLGYMLVRALLSNDLSVSFVDHYTKVALSMLMLPLGYVYVHSWELLRRLHIVVLTGGCIIVAQFLVAQLLEVGKSVYLEDSFFVGGAGVQTTYWLSLALVVSPLMYAQFRSQGGKTAAAAVLIFFLITIVLVLRRGAILGVVVGVAGYVVLSKRKTAMLKRFALAGALILMIAPVYLPILMPRLTARSLANRPLEAEARFLETFVVLDELQQKPVSHAIFGSQLFNSAAYFGMRRPLHVDYNVILHGAGIIGMLLASSIYVAIAIEHRRAYRWSRGDVLADELNAVLFAVLLMSLAISVSGSITSIGYRSMLFLYLGAFLGVGRRAHDATRREHRSVTDVEA